MSRIYGYVRVSSKDQNEARQLEAMREVGVDEKLVFVDKQSGRDFDRPQYQLLKRIIDSGDVLMIHSLDRLGRNYQQIREEWRELTERGVGIKVLDMPMLDTSADKDLTGRFISDLVLQVLSFVAEKEYHSIKERQRQGIAAAKAKGIRLGRKPVAVPDGFGDIVRRWRTKEITFAQAKQLSGLSRTMFYKFAKESTMDKS